MTFFKRHLQFCLSKFSLCDIIGCIVMCLTCDEYTLFYGSWSINYFLKFVSFLSLRGTLIFYFLSHCFICKKWSAISFFIGLRCIFICIILLELLLLSIVRLFFASELKFHQHQASFVKLDKQKHGT